MKNKKKWEKPKIEGISTKKISSVFTACPKQYEKMQLYICCQYGDNVWTPISS